MQLRGRGLEGMLGPTGMRGRRGRNWAPQIGRKSLHPRRSMLAPRSLNPNICGRASRSGWMGEAKRRSVGDRKRAESPTEGHNTLFCFFARRVIAATPTHNTLRYQTKTHTCDRPLRGRDRGDQQSAQGGSRHTPTTDHHIPQICHTEIKYLLAVLLDGADHRHVPAIVIVRPPDLLRDLFLEVCDRSAEHLDWILGVCDRSSARFIRWFNEISR